MTFVRWVETIGIVAVLMLSITSLQMSNYQHDMEVEAEHAELFYLRAWKNAHNDSIKIKEQQDQCLQDAFKMLKPFLLFPLGPIIPHMFPITPPDPDMTPRGKSGVA